MIWNLKLHSWLFAYWSAGLYIGQYVATQMNHIPHILKKQTNSNPTSD